MTRDLYVDFGELHFSVYSSLDYDFGLSLGRLLKKISCFLANDDSERPYINKHTSKAQGVTSPLFAMPKEEYLSDDFVASLLCRDAKENTIKYSALGLESLFPQRSLSLV